MHNLRNTSGLFLLCLSISTVVSIGFGTPVLAQRRGICYRNCRIRIEKLFQQGERKASTWHPKPLSPTQYSNINKLLTSQQQRQDTKCKTNPHSLDCFQAELRLKPHQPGIRCKTDPNSLDCFIEKSEQLKQ